MNLFTLTQLAEKMRWPVLAAKFNTHFASFPTPVETDETGQGLYDLAAVASWDRNRPVEG